MSSTATVVVLTPPAVEPGLPPMNISAVISRLPETDSLLRSVVKNPAVRAETEWKNDTSSCLPVLMPARLLFCSNKKKNSQPNIHIWLMKQDLAKKYIS